MGRRKKNYFQRFCNFKCYGNYQRNRPKKQTLTYNGIHSWIKKHYIKLDKCEHCGKNPGINKAGNSKLQWANKSGKYLRERNDWLCLCHSCHAIFDLSEERLKHLSNMSKKSVKLEKFKKRERNNKGQYI